MFSHELRGLVGVHASGGLVQQQHLGMGRQRTENLQPSLGAIRKVARPLVGECAHVEDVQETQRLRAELSLLPPVARKPEDVARQVRGHGVGEAHQHVLGHRHLGEETDVLEGAGDAHLVDLHHGLPGRVVAIKQDGATRGPVHVGEQVEDRGLAGTVWPDDARDLRAAHGDVEVVHGREAPEVDAQVLRLQHGNLAQIPLGNEVGRLHLHEDGAVPLGCHLLARHARSSPDPLSRHSHASREADRS